MDLAVLNKALSTTPVSQLRAFDVIGSTNDEALHWLDTGATDFSLVIADTQTKGRGRFERKWVTQPGASLAFTVVFKPTPAELSAPSALYAPLCGLAVWQTLHDAFALEPQIKWPNDILLERRKCCGILVEAAWSGTQLNGIVLGIGINITQAALPPTTAPLFPATWIEKFTQTPVDRFDLLAKVLNSLNAWRSKLGNAEFFDTWQKNLAFRGELVRIEQIEKTSIIGIVKGIDAQGNLLLLDESGAEIAIEVGDVHLRPADKDAGDHGR